MRTIQIQRNCFEQGKNYQQNYQTETRSKRKTQYNSAQLQPEKYKLQFKYSFQDYLKLALCKIIPQEGIIINPREGFVIGLKDECIKLKKKAEKELSSRKYKKIEFKKEADLDEIQFELDAKFEARIFRSGYIDRALTVLSGFDSLELSCLKFREVLKQKKSIILRIKSDCQNQCMQKIQKILKDSSEPAKQKHYQSTQSKSYVKHKVIVEEEYEEIQEEEVNYYQMIQPKSCSVSRVEKKILDELNESRLSISIEESSFSLTQTNSSDFMDEEPENITWIQRSSTNRSLM